MDANALGTLIGSFGLPVVIVLGLGIFAGKSIWPYIVKRIEVNDQERAKRHAEYMAEMAGIRENGASTAKVLFMIEERLSNHEIATGTRVDDIKKTTEQATGSLRELIDSRYQSLLHEIQARK